MVYTPRLSHDSLLLGLKGSLNEYELDLLPQRSAEARREKAPRGELVVSAPIGYSRATGSRLLGHARSLSPLAPLTCGTI
jgi:DNA invertase Pin-like site-specific DNA recombinase